MRLEQSFDVAAPLDAVWEAFGDVERIAPCLPGARVTGRDEDGTYRGELNAGLARLRGTVRVTGRDDATRTMTLQTGTAEVTLTFEEGTRVHTAAEIDDSSKNALFGPMLQDVAARLMRDFGACLAAKLNAPSGADVAAGAVAPEAVDGDGRGPGPAPSGAAVAAGEAAPEETLAAAPDGDPDPDSAAG